MPIRCKCSACGKGGRVPDTYAGMVINCPACGESMQVPTLEEAAAAEKAAGGAKPAAPKPAAPAKTPAPPTIMERPPKPAAPAPRKPQPPTVIDRAPPEALAPTKPKSPESKPAESKPASKPAAPTLFEKAPPKPAAKPAAPTLFEKAPGKPASSETTLFDRGPERPAGSETTLFDKPPPGKKPAAAPTVFEKREPASDLPDLDGLDLPGGDAAPLLDLGDFDEPAPAKKPAAQTVFDRGPGTEEAADVAADEVAPASSIMDEEAAEPAATPAAKQPTWANGPLVDLGLALVAAGLAMAAWLGTELPPLTRPVTSVALGGAPGASFKVEIDAQNTVKVNGSPVANPEAVAVAVESAGAPSQVLIEASGEALYGTIERVISAAGRGGAVSVQLATLQ